MATETLSALVREVRAEAGHALSVSQGLNTVETLKHLIRRTEKELWVSFDWPTLVIRRDIDVAVNQVLYSYPSDMAFDQIRHVYWGSKTNTSWHEVEYGIPEDGIVLDGTTGTTIQFWDTYDGMIRFWPIPSMEGVVRLKGMKPLNALVNDDDYCTLDPTLLTLLVSAELLTRAKAEDAQAKTQKAQRHLQKLLANKTSRKAKVSTFGASRHPSNRLTPYIDYIP